MSLSNNLANIDKRNNQLLKLVLQHYAGKLEKIFDCLVPHWVETNEFGRYTFSYTTLNAKQGKKTNSDQSRVRIVPKYGYETTKLEYWDVTTIIDAEARMEAKGLPFDVPQSIAMAHGYNAALEFHRDFAVELAESNTTNFSGDRLISPQSVWSDDANIDSRKDMQNLLQALHDESGYDPENLPDGIEIIAIISPDRKKEAVNGADYLEWHGKASTDTSKKDSEKLAAFWGVPKINVISATTEDGTDTYSNITVLTIYDRRGINNMLIAPNSKVLIPNDSGFLAGFGRSDAQFIEAYSKTLANGLHETFTNSMIHSFIKSDHHEDEWITTKASWKVYPHKLKSMVSLNGA